MTMAPEDHLKTLYDLAPPSGQQSWVNLQYVVLR